jgi:photosystem II stability/assembly factor-like uncharacterized protein
LRQRLKITVIASLVLLNAALLFLLNEKMSDSKVPVDDSELTGTTPTPDSSPEPKEPGGPQGIAVADDGTIFRFFAGACAGQVGPGITVSTDEGATFAEVALPEGVRSVFTVTAKTADDITVIAAGEDCKAQRHVTTDAGAGWRAVKSAGGWYLHPGTAAVFSPRGKVDPGCAQPVAVGAVSRLRARVFCASGALVGTADSGRTWEPMGVLDGAKTGAFPSANVGYALAPDGGCRTRSFTTENRGITWTPAGCLAGGPGRALAVNGDLLAAIAGDAVFVSEDGGRNWSKTP